MILRGTWPTAAMFLLPKILFKWMRVDSDKFKLIRDNLPLGLIGKFDEKCLEHSVSVSTLTGGLWSITMMRYLLVHGREKEERSQGLRPQDAGDEDDEPDDRANPFKPIDKQLEAAQVKISCVNSYTS
jgi:hypothetical protein